MRQTVSTALSLPPLVSSLLHKQNQPGLSSRLTKGDEGIDIYFDNVGGPHLSATLEHMNNYGRIIACGMISQYNLPDSERHGVTNLQNMISRRLTMRGFILTDPDLLRYFEEATTNMTKWLRDGELKAKTYEVVGIERAAEACVGVFKGEGLGKAVLKIES